MRKVTLWAVLVVGCAGEGSPGTAQRDAPGGGGGGLPTPICGAGPCAECVGCSPADQLCVGSPAMFTLGVGSCVAHVAAGGTFDAMIDATAFAATDAAAAVDGQDLEIVARTGTRAVAVLTGARLGDATCSATSVTAIHYYPGDGRVLRASTCVVQLTRLGAVGERVEGTLAATFDDGTLTIRLTAGTFSVVRAPFP